MDLTVVMPTFNDQKRIAENLNALIGFLQSQDYSFEIITVDDGSRDHTLAILLQMESRYSELSVFTQHPNRGKGYSVKKGMLKATGKKVIFMDSDLATPLTEIPRIIEVMDKNKLDVVIGTRLESKRIWFRKIPGASFLWLAKYGLGLKYTDTQCGFKLFTRNAVQTIFPGIKTKGFAFDVELLLSARDKGLSVGEVAVRWEEHAKSSVRVWHGVQAFADLLRMFFGRRANV
jgi:dolichyl-phosphate beta-glucosyltransferase